MGRRAVLLTAFLLAIAVGVPADASDGDVDRRALRRLLQAPDEPARPTLGLLGAREAVYRPAEALEPDPDERPGSDGEEDDDETRDPDDVMDWIERVGGVREAVAADLLRRIAVDVEVRLPGGRVERSRLVAASGRRAMFSRTRSVRVVADYAAEIACDNSGGLRPSAVGDPILDTLREGLVVDVRPFLVGDGTRVALDVALQAGRFDDPVARVDTEARFLGNLDLPRYTGALLFASGTASVGEPLDMVLGGGTKAGVALRLTPRVLDVGVGDSKRRSTVSVHRIDAGLLVAPTTAARFAGSPDTWWNPPRHVLPALGWSEPVAPRGRVWGLVLDLLPDVPWFVSAEGCVWLQASAPDAARLRGTLDAWTARAARTAEIEITARSAGEVVGRVVVPVLTGRTAFFRLGTDRAVLLDASVEVG